MSLSKLIIRTPISLLVVAMVISGFMTLISNNKVSAAPVVGFSPGYIISDNIFTNNQSMTVSKIQTFLNSKVSNCDTNGTQIATDFGSTLTHAQYAASRGWAPPPYTCLKDYMENGISAAQIIYNAAQNYQINPQVLIVLLQKEQGLVTDTWPLSTQYRSATGYGCPDTAPCDSQYYGLTNQVNWAATMYHAIMTASPTWYTPYIVGNNYIRYNPNASCGGSTVNILNRATQALYNYTPYQPNQAALNAGYGIGDSCSAYGNRNFYQYFSDWFGSPMYGNFVRTPNNATVYLVTSVNKYPIADINILGALYQLGGVTYVNDSYLNTKTTGPKLGRVIKSNSSSTIYFYDAGIKLAFGSCSQIEAYGSSCAQVITLDDYQVNALSNGPGMTNVLKTTSGKTFYMDGTKHEVYDDASLVANNISTSSNTLNETSLNNLAYGSPILRDDVIVGSRSNNKLYLSQGGTLVSLPDDISKLSFFANLDKESLDENSIINNTINNGFVGFVQSSAGDKYLINSLGKLKLTSPSKWTNSFVTFTDSLLSAIPTSSQSEGEGFVKADNNSSIYMVVNGTAYPIASWGDFINLHTDKSSQWLSIPGSTLNSMSVGTVIYSPGNLVKTNSSATVYVINGLLRKIALPSFTISRDLGLSDVKTISQAELDAFTQETGNIGNFVSCGGSLYLANLGLIYEIDTEAMSDYGYSSVSGSPWDSLGCSNLKKSNEPLSTFKFLKSTSSKTIYYVDGGKKRPISSMSTFTSLGGSSINTLTMSISALDTIEDGLII